MRWIPILAFVVSLTVPQWLSAQVAGTVAGVVTGPGGQPLSGAAVGIAETTLGAQTGADGRFTITGVPAGSRTVRATFPGHAEATRTVTVVAGQTLTVNIALVAQVVQLEGVVAVGYGTARRQDVTGSVASVSVADLEVAGTASLGQMLQGRVAGAQVTQNNGAPGAGISIRVRGTASISAASEPLYVIDGVPAPAGGGNNAYTNPLAAINPNDIESIEVLKDASSTAIYGARGAAGVVLVTTKRGLRGSDLITVESSYGFQSPARRLDMLNGPQFASLIDDARVNAGLSRISPMTGAAFSQAQYDSILAAGPGTDWQSLVLRNAPVQSHNVSFSGGDDRTRFHLSGSLFDQEGIIIGSQFRRYSGRVNLDRTMSDRLQVGTNLTLSNIEEQQQPTDNGLGNGAVMSALWFNPILGPREANGDWLILSPVTWPATNPVANATDNFNRTTRYSTVGSVFGDLTLAEGLRLRSTFAVNSVSSRALSYSPRTTPTGRGNLGSANASSNQALNLTQENIFSYNRLLGPGTLDLTGGNTIQTNRSEALGAANSQFGNDLTGVYDLGSGTRPTASTDFSQWGLVSFLGRANYNFMDRYLFTATGRGDGSSRFGANSKWGFFPSGAFAWRMIDESFLRNQNLFTDLKLRLSYGVTGNQEIGLYQSLERLTTVNSTAGGQPVVGFATAGSAPNPDLKWETTRQYNAGLDFGIFGNRISGSIDAYHSVTKDLLLSVSLPRSSGFSTQLRNVGSVQNDGIELSLNTINLESGNAFWRSTLTLAHNRNEVIDLGVAQELPVANQKGINGQTGQNVIIMRVGQPLGTFVGKKTDGLYQEGDACPLTVVRPTLDCVPGEYRYVDSNGDGVINSNDNVILGNGQPDLYGGLSNNIGFGRFELNTFLQFSYGAQIMNAPAINMKQMNTFSNQTIDGLNRWTPTNTNTTVPRANANRPRELYDVHVEDGSFIRLQSLTLGYSVPGRLIPMASSARVFLMGQNLHVWTKYSGFDPEVNSFGADATAPGVDAGSYPRARTWTTGVNLTF